MIQILWVVVPAVLLGLGLLLGSYFSLWLTAYVTGVRVRLHELLLMSLRGVPARLVVNCKIQMVHSGLPDVPTHELEAQYLAGGDVQRITLALIAAQRAGIPLEWKTATAIDLAGRNILEGVQRSVNPIVIDCPDPKDGRGETLDGVAQDGIQIKVRVRVTARIEVSALIGGVSEATLVARVGEAIVSAIGACASYRDALRDPAFITRQALAKRVDSQSAFAILSIDIANMLVGENVGATLQLKQAEADIRVARAAAESRRAMAVAAEQEMRALIQEHRAALVLAEAAIPPEIAQAYQRGQLEAAIPGAPSLRLVPPDEGLLPWAQ